MKTVDTATATPIATDFPSALSAIRLSANERSARRSLHRREAERLQLQRRVAGLEFVDRVEHDLVLLLDELVSELHLTPNRSHRLFDGRFLLALRWDDAPPRDATRRDPVRSRVELLLEPLSEAGRFRLELRATVRGRDLPSESFEVELGAEGRQAVADFAQERLLNVARAYVRGEPLKRAS